MDSVSTVTVLSSPLAQDVAAAVTPARVSAYTPELDGFRATAIWTVMLMHVFIGFPDYTPGILPRLLSPVQFGWLGVDLFFVLSGFLITGILLDSRDQPRYWRNFYGRRVLRILPVYVVVVSITAVVYRGYGAFFALATAFMANYAPALHIPMPHGPGVLWSLAIEEQFYLLWPLLVWVCGRKRLMWLAAAIVIATPAGRWIWRLHGGSPDRLYDLSWFRFDGLALGAFLAGWVRMPALKTRHSIALATGLTALSVIVTAAALPFGVFTTHTAASGALRFTQAHLNFAAALLMAFTFRGTFWTAPLRSGVARISSLFSYCLYLVHLCVIDLWWVIEQHFGLRPAGVSYASWGVARMAIVLAISFTIAALSWRYLEQPVLRLKRHFA